MQRHWAVNVIPKTRFKSSQHCVTMQPEVSFMHNDNHQVSKSEVSLINQDVAIRSRSWLSSSSYVFPLSARWFTWSSATFCDDGMRTFISCDCIKRCCEHLCFCSPADQLRPYYSVIKSAQIHPFSSRLFSLRNSVSAYVAPGIPLQCKKRSVITQDESLKKINMHCFCSFTEIKVTYLHEYEIWIV